MQQNLAGITIYTIREAEQKILNYMISSHENFKQIKNTLQEDDFTFFVHKTIFEYFLHFEESFLEISELNKFVSYIAGMLESFNGINSTSVKSILSQAPKESIIEEFALVLTNANQKNNISKDFNAKERKGVINIDDNVTTLHFLNDQLMSIKSTSISLLPNVVHNSFSITLESISNLLDKDITVTYYGDTQSTDTIDSFVLQRTIVTNEDSSGWFESLCSWADRYNLASCTFPRDKEKLKNLEELYISECGIHELAPEIGKLINLKVLNISNNSIEKLPKELFSLKNLTTLRLENNNVSYISDEIINLLHLSELSICHNYIEYIPQSIYKLKKLEILTLHGNKLTTISDQIVNLQSLKALSISNNNISSIPAAIGELKDLEILRIENNNISDVSVKILQLPKLIHFCIDDNLLAFVSTNKDHLQNMNMLNLMDSHITKYPAIVEIFDYFLDVDEWMEERDRRENGCVIISKAKGEVVWEE